MLDYIPLARSVAREFRRQYGGDLEELEGAALLGLVKIWPRYRPELGAIEPYLNRKIWYAIIDWHRVAEGTRRLRKPRHHQLITSTEFENASWQDILAVEDKDCLEIKDQVDFLLRQLSVRDRWIFELHYLEGFTQQRVGLFLGINATYVNHRLKYCKEYLCGLPTRKLCSTS